MDSESVNRQSVTGFELLGEVNFPTGFLFAETEVGGLSGLTYDVANGIYYALSDDRSQINPARFYTLGIDLSDGSLDDGDVTFSAVTTLTDFSGQPFAPNTVDPEGIALTPTSTLLISSEGNANDLIPPFVTEFSLDGAAIDAFPVPEIFLPTADQSSGIRNNLAFESLTITPNGQFAYTAVENALFQDGPSASVDEGSLARIIQYDLENQEPIGEFVYEVDPVPTPPNPADGFSDNGLVELLALDNNGTLLALERSFAVGVGNTIRLYEVQTQGALDVSGTDDLFREDPLEDDGEILPPGPFEIDPAVSKRLLLDVEADLGVDPDNLEALSFGPTLPDGRQSLILASDNNFNANGQITQFIAVGLEITETPVVAPVVETPYTLDDDGILEVDPLDILLVNDDGFEAEGIEVLFNALVEAGHNVTFVAPKEQQSGQGTRISVDSLFQPTEVVEFAPNQFFVDATPVTTTQAALDFILEGEEPDLVIAGINEGENVGANIAISSGTVSAATTATRAGIPAIAVSAGTLRDENFAVDEAALTAAYDFGADFVVDLVSQLSVNQGDNPELLPDGVGLNVNIPAVVSEIEGTALTVLDDTGTFNLFVADAGAGPSLLFSVGEALEPEEITVANSEGQNFLADFVTITPIDGDWTAGDAVRQSLSDRFDAAPDNAMTTPLNILVTNDDGFNAEGIEILSEILAAAGHRVTVVAPLEQQSGTGTALDVGLIGQPLDIVETGDDAFSVNAGVRTTTWAGLDFVLDGEAPDLVVSGINAGENIGPGGAVSSGTVSAAVTALLRDVPAIAISGGLDPATFETPTETYTAGADFLVELIAKLQVTQEEETSFLPEDIGLSINIPTRLPEGVTEIQGVAFTNASDTTPFIIDFGPIDDMGNAGLRFAPAPAPETPDPLSEGDQFLSGFITVTPIDGNWTASLEEQSEASEQLDLPIQRLAGDSDDPAIYVHPTNPSESLVIATLKDGGLAVFDLEGNIVQSILDADFGEIRYNNVDLVYGFQIGDEPVDIAVVSDRANDTLAIFAIDPETNQLTDITAPDILETIFGVDDGSATAYGLATYTSPLSGDSFAFVTQRDGDQVAQVQLLDNGDGTVAAELVRTLQLPVPTGDPEDSQSEGIVVDQELGFLYVALEDQVGILRFSAEVDGGDDFSVIRPLDAPELTADIEGLTIYYGPDGTGYLIANSQGDSSYAVYRREGTNEFLGSFAVGDNGSIDQANESDGLDIINVPLGDAFPNGLLVVQDGANDPQNVVEDDEELENNSTNFKYVPVESVAAAFPVPLVIDTDSYDPRNPEPQSLVNGIASGDTTQTTTVLWARSTFPGEVTFEYSTSLNFATLAGTATATVTDVFQPVKVEIEDLEPGTEYFYRVTDAAGDSEVGRFQTSAAAGELAGLSFGVAGDWRGELAPYPAIANVATQNLEFFVEHGDTIYADIPSPGLLNPDGTRNPQAETLEEFRAKHAEVYSTRFGENYWAELRASTSVVATIDDHEVTNDFAGGADVSTDPRFAADPPGTLVNDSQLYENGLQVFQEYNPIRDDFYGDTGDPRTAFERELYRHNTYGNDAATFLLDTRSFRDPALENPDATQLAIDLATGVDPTTAFTNFVVNEVIPFEVAAFDDTRTFLSDAQLDDLKQDLLDSQNNGVTWKFVLVPEPIQTLGPLLGPSDRFDGYLAERTEILQFIEANNIDNVVFVAADIHGTIVNNVTYQEAPGGPQIPTSVFEITTGSVAFDAPFGQSVVGGAAAGGFVSPEQFEFYQSLPILGDTNTFTQDDFFTTLLNDTALAPFGLDPAGLDNNLPGADGLIDAELVQGRYVATHTYGWTQFDIDPRTQALTVTTYGIEPYSEAELLSTEPGGLDEILAREPVIVSQFVVNPQNFEPVDAPPILGTPGDDFIFAGDDTDFSGIEDIVFTGAGNDDVDIALAADDGTGGNRVNTGSDDDVITVSRRDRISGSTGDDLFDAEFSLGDNRMSGGAGDDVFVLGGDRDRALGGDGEDTFEILASASRNIIAGGADADTFFLLPNGEVPESVPEHQILDFDAGTDILSFGIGITAADVAVGADGSNATLSLFNLELATFSGVSQANLQMAVDDFFS